MIVNEIVRAIQRNPKIKKVVVSPLEHAKIRREFTKMVFVKPTPRPTYGPPFGDIDRQLWDALRAQKRFATIQIMGRPVVVNG